MKKPPKKTPNLNMKKKRAQKTPDLVQIMSEISTIKADVLEIKCIVMKIDTILNKLIRREREKLIATPRRTGI